MDFTKCFHLSKRFYFHPNLNEAFSFVQIQLKLLDHTQMFLIYSNVSNFSQTWMNFLVGLNLTKAVGITTRFQFTQRQCLFCH